MTEQPKNGCHCTCSSKTNPSATETATPKHHRGLGDITINHANDSRHGGKAHNEDEFNSASPSVDDDRPGMNSAQPSTHLAEKHAE